jgi:signal peptidase I
VIKSKKSREFEIGAPPRKRHRAAMIVADVFFAVCILIFAGAIFLSVQAKKSGEAVEVAGWRPYLIATGSMLPTYQINGLVITHDDNFDDAKVGDVVAFSAAGLNGQPALHRVMAISGDGANKQLWVKGDNNQHPDGAPVTRQNYLGRAKFNTNLTAWFVTEIHKPGGWIRAVLIPLLILILIYVGARWFITAQMTWRGRVMALSLAVFLLSAALLFSYTLSVVKQVERTNSDLAKIAQNFAESSASKTWKIRGQTVIGRIEIPKLKLDYPIVDYNTATTMNLTIAQFGGAPLNGTGNAILVGHHAWGDLSPFDLFFTKIDSLKKGDEIFITDATRTRAKYVVQDFGMISANDNDVLVQLDGDVREITLISTSYDLENRYAVRAVSE